MTSHKAQNIRNPRLKRNPIENLEQRQSPTVKSTDELKKMGNGILEQIMGQKSYEDLYSKEQYPYGETRKRAPRQEFKLFDKREYEAKQETETKIHELTTLIRQEIEAIKNVNSSLMSEVSDIQKISLETLSEKPGEYHIKFLEIILSMLRTIKLRIGESGTWLEALQTKRQKRGSLFLSLSKRKGTQYSLSQEIQSSRSVQ